MKYPKPESVILEFKREWPGNIKIIKTVVAFCNTHGGRIIVGVSDSQEIIGISEHQIEVVLEFLDKAIFEACSPPIIPRVYVQRIEEKTVLIIEISEGMNKPYALKADMNHKGKGVYIRVGQNTLPASREDVLELEWQTKGIDFEKRPVYEAPLEALNPVAIQDFLKKRTQGGETELTDQVMQAYHLRSDEQIQPHPTVLAILLFGYHPQHYYSEAMIICSHFRGVSGRETLATLDCEGTLFHQINQVMHFLTTRLYREFTIGEIGDFTIEQIGGFRLAELKRNELLEIPQVAIREALMNMIVHRNYHIKGPAKIAIYDDRVEFFSPGQFPRPMENLKTGCTYLRNPGIYKVLRESGYVEKLGTGFITIFESYEKRKLKTPSIIEGEGFVKCILPRVKQEAIVEKSDFTLMMALFNKSEEITVQEVVKVLAISKPTAVRRLNQMMQDQLIKRVGKTKNIHYRLIK